MRKEPVQVPVDDYRWERGKIKSRAHLALAVSIGLSCAHIVTVAASKGQEKKYEELEVLVSKTYWEIAQLKRRLDVLEGGGKVYYADEPCSR